MGRALKTFKGDLEKRLEKYGREGFVIETVTIKHNTRELAENPRTYITIRLSKYLGNDAYKVVNIKIEVEKYINKAILPRSYEQLIEFIRKLKIDDYRIEEYKVG